MRRAALAVYLFGCGVSGGSVPALAQEANRQATVLHLSETAGRPVTRDLLRVELRVEETGTVPQSVQAAINPVWQPLLTGHGRSKGADRNRRVRHRPGADGKRPRAVARQPVSHPER